jgi:hypothetical protein
VYIMKYSLLPDLVSYVQNLPHRILIEVKVRIPHIFKSDDYFFAFNHFKCWRLYGFKPYNRFAIIDYTYHTTPYNVWYLKICGYCIIKCEW